jgi:hypothetical protein
LEEKEMYPSDYTVELSSGIYEVKAFGMDQAIILAQAQAIKQGKTYEYVRLVQ